MALFGLTTAFLFIRPPEPVADSGERPAAGLRSEVRPTGDSPMDSGLFSKIGALLA
jgi:hypothetical protein